MFRNALRLCLSAAVLSSSVLAVSSAHAFDVVSLGVGFQGVIGGNFLDKPDNKIYNLPDGRSGPMTPSYPGFGGFSYGGGLAFDVRFLEIVGLEVDVIRSSDKAHADVDFGNGARTYTVNVGQAAWHVPVLLKGVLPLPVLSPFVLVGPEFVMPGTPVNETPAEYPAGYVKSSASSYKMWTFGLGAEASIPGLSALRIPFSIRGSYNPSTGNSVNDRARWDVTGNKVNGTTYITEWKFRPEITLGVSYFF